MGRSLPMGGPGRLPPRVRDENALLYMSFHLPCNLSRPTERSTSPPTASSSLAAPSTFRRSSSLAARPLFSPDTALCTYSMLNSSIRNIIITKITIISCRLTHQQIELQRGDGIWGAPGVAGRIWSRVSHTYNRFDKKRRSGLRRFWCEKKGVASRPVKGRRWKREGWRVGKKVEGSHEKRVGVKMEKREIWKRFLVKTNLWLRFELERQDKAQRTRVGMEHRTAEVWLGLWSPPKAPRNGLML